MMRNRLAVALVLFSACGGGDAAPAPEPAAPFQTPSWVAQLEDSTALFIGLSVVDENVVWASGNGGRVARTIDGGATWTVRPVPGEEAAQFRDVHAFSAEEAYVVSIPTPRSSIYHTDDGGQTWTRVWQADGDTPFLDCFSFWEPRRGFVFGDSENGEFSLLQTSDGVTWNRVDPSIVPDARPGEGAFAASGTCVVTRPGGLGWFSTGASGVDARVIRTTDYGATWAEAISPIPSVDPTSGIFSLAFRDDQHGAAFGGNLSQPDSTHEDVAVTADGGATWTLVGRTGLKGAVYGAAYVPGTATPTLVAVSPDGSAFSTDEGRTWTRIDNRNSWTVAFHGPRAGWVAGQGHISRLR
jgi:photosystem II stability/assembly factor-like uncharacterized protein